MAPPLASTMKLTRNLKEGREDEGELATGTAERSDAPKPHVSSFVNRFWEFWNFGQVGTEG